MMKSTLFTSVIIAVLCFFVASSQAQIFGSPSATLEQGKMSIGIASGYEECDVSHMNRGYRQFNNVPSDIILSYGIFD